MVKVGIIGGSGLDDAKILEGAREIVVTTSCGRPNSPLTMGAIEGREVAILARHGRGHVYPPTEVNYRANVLALKDQGCTHVLATTACGSLREEIRRGDFVVLDQFIDFTRRRPLSLFERFEFGAENAKHTAMADPFDEGLRQALIGAAKELGLRFHERGTVITIEGSRFSTRAESRMFRMWGADVINMSVAPEAIFANEAGLPYAAVAMATDYDSWKTDEPPADWGLILEVFNQNVENVKKLLLKTLPRVGA